MKKQGRNVVASFIFDNISGLLKEALFSVPIVGNVRAGAPALAVEDIEGYVQHESFGIYRYLNSLRTPLYITPPKSINYTDLIREISSYA